jgi:hypothetical protein
VEAELFQREMKAGRNGAVLVLARGDDGLAVDCVVKLAKAMAPEQVAMLPVPYLCEWLATAIGGVLGIRTPAPYEVVITKEYAEAITDEKQRRIALGSLGSVFGCEHVSSGTSQYTLELPDLSLRTPAAELVAFDVFIHNADRRRENPNLFVARGDLVAFDHGDAFAFLLPILGASDPATDELAKVVEQHACRPWLHHREFSLERFSEALALLTDDVLQQIATATPASWQVGLADGKLSYIVDVLKKRRDAVAEWLPKVEACLTR